jgi:glycosyltransferase involved in cell wall biosynthesis
MPSLSFIVPGRIETRTGGYIYDRRMALALRELGWSVTVQEIGESFPEPTKAALANAAQTLAGLPDDALVLVDGLAFGAMPAEAEREAARLRLVALVHHPLAAETGIERDLADRLEASEKRALAAARGIIVTSQATASMLTNSGVSRERIAVVEPGTDSAPLARGSHSAVLHLLCVATLIPRKGHEILIRALASISDRNWRLTCAGSLERDPSTVERVRAALRTTGLEDSVALDGEADAAMLAGHYDRADLFVLPTEYEGYGMVVAEALAHGLPVIGTATGAIPELLAADAGLVVPPGDQQALAAALSSVLRNPILRKHITAGARRKRNQLAGWEVAAGKLATALEQTARDGQLQR